MFPSTSAQALLEFFNENPLGMFPEIRQNVIIFDMDIVLKEFDFQVKKNSHFKKKFFLEILSNITI